MSVAIKTNRRWLKSAIEAASQEKMEMPWAAKRIARPAQASSPLISAPGLSAPVLSASVIRIFPSAPIKYAAIAAR